MNEILKPGQTVHTESSRITCTVEKFLGAGGQGEVYQANLGGKPIALKWYFPHYLQQDPQQRERLETAIEFGTPSDKFLWPMELASATDVPWEICDLNSGNGTYNQWATPTGMPDFTSRRSHLTRSKWPTVFKTTESLASQLAHSLGFPRPEFSYEIRRESDARSS